MNRPPLTAATVYQSGKSASPVSCVCLLSQSREPPDATAYQWAWRSRPLPLVRPHLVDQSEKSSMCRPTNLEVSKVTHTCTSVTLTGNTSQSRPIQDARIFVVTRKLSHMTFIGKPAARGPSLCSTKLGVSFCGDASSAVSPKLGKVSRAAISQMA